MLGAVLVDNAAFNSAAEILTRDDFYRESHRRIFDAMAALAETSQPIDLVTLKDELRARVGARGGGRRRATSRCARGRRPAHHQRRALEPDHQGEGGSPEPDPRQQPHRAVVPTRREDEAAALLDRAEKSIFEHRREADPHRLPSMREIVKESFRTIDQLSQSKDLVTGLATGFVDIDEMTSGLQKGDLVIVAARPAMGKTSFCLNVAQHAALRAGETVGLFSLEMSKEQLVLRMLCADARIDAHRLRTGKLNEKDWARLAKAYADLSQSRLFIDDSATHLAARDARQVPSPEGGARPRALIIVDYLQLVTAAGRVREPPAGDLGDQPLDEGPGQGAGLPGDRALAALARAGGAYRPAAPALGPSRERSASSRTRTS